MRDAARQGGGNVERVLHTSVATLYSNLVTRPTGRAVRIAIERQLREMRGPCLSILDFSEVEVIDFSCADEVVAKLLLQYRPPGRPTEAYFMARVVSDVHREPIEAVLQRHGLLLVALAGGGSALWGPAPRRLREAWERLTRVGRVLPDEFASLRGVQARTASAWLRRLAALRVAIEDGENRFLSLPTLLEQVSATRR